MSKNTSTHRFLGTLWPGSVDVAAALFIKTKKYNQDLLKNTNWKYGDRTDFKFIGTVESTTNDFYKTSVLAQCT